MTRDARAPRRILLIQLRRLGDVVLTTALLEDCQRVFPSTPVDFLVGEAPAPLLEAHPLIDRRLVLGGGSMHAAAMARAIRAARYDWVIDAQGSTRTALLSAASGAPVRAGWDVRGKGWAYTATLSRTRQPEYVARERQRLLEMLDVPVGPACPRLVLTDAERALGAAQLEQAGVPAGASVAGMLLSTRESVKDWPAEDFGAVAAELARGGVVPLLFQTAGDAERVARVRAIAPDAVVMPALPLRHFLAVLARCTVFLSGDTGPAHMADALGVPRVTIFGATLPAAWMPERPTARAVFGPMTRDVPMRERRAAAARGAVFTAGITSARVLDEVHALLREDGAHPHRRDEWTRRSGR